MAGKLDEISASIGELRANTKRLTELFDRHCDDDDRRHSENTATLGEIKEALQPLSSAVGIMQPIVAGYAVSQWKRAGAVGLAIALLTGLGWVLEALIGRMVMWAIERWH